MRYLKCLFSISNTNLKNTVLTLNFGFSHLFQVNLDSSVECVARGQRNFRFALRSPDGAISGQKRVFWAVFGVFRLPDKQDVPGNQEATNQRPSLAQAWPLYIHTIERTKGCHFWSKKGGFWGGFRQAGREGRKTRGRPLRAAYETVPRCSIWYGAKDLIKVPRLSNIWHHIFGTTYLAQTAP